jgi:hypothetical protein
MNTNYNMDSIFQQKINGLEMPFQVADWSLMEKILDTSFVEGKVNMTENITEAERIIAEKIEGHAMESMPEDWQMFEKTLQENTFDNLVANSLLQHEIAMPASDWADFEKDLTTQNFDNQFQTLQNYEMPLEMGLWEDLDADLTAAPFEAIFAEKLNNVTQNPPHKDWAEMASKLDQADFDVAVSKHLQLHEMTYLPADWKVMVALLDKNEEKPVAGFWDWRKFAILGALLLGGTGAALLWTKFDGKQLPKAVIGEPKPYDKEVKSSVESLPKVDDAKKEEAEKPENKQVNAEIVKHSLSSNKQNQPNRLSFIQQNKGVKVEKKAELNQTNRLNLAYADFQFLQNDGGEKVEGNTSPVISVPIEKKLENVPVERNIPVLEKTKDDSTKNTAPETKVFAENKSQVVENKVVDAENALIPEKQKSFEIRQIGSVSPLIMQNLHTNVTIPISPKNTLPSAISLGWYASPLQSLAELNSKGKNGFSTGLRMEIGTETDAFVTGALYADKRFETRYFKYSAKFQQNYEHLLRGHIQEIGLPFLYKHNFKVAKGFSLYAQGGLIPIVTIREEYEHADPTNAANVGVSDLSRMKMDVEEKAYHKYLGYAQFSPGLQYKYKHFSVFAEPYFQWGMQRMSTEQKRMSSYGVGFGFLYRFGQ